MQNNDLNLLLARKRILVATHVYGTGASQDLVRFLVEHKTKNVLFIGHPLFYDPQLKGSGFELYAGGKKVRQQYTVHRKIPLFLSYVIHIGKSLIWTIRTGMKWDVYIGSNNLNAYVGLLLKKLGFVTKVVYYVIDYNPFRYDNAYLNRFYHWLDEYCVKYSDETWNLSPRMERARKKYFNFSGGRQKVVPVGLWKDAWANVPNALVDKHTAVFLGHILEKQGVQHVLAAIPAIRKRVPGFHFLVLGGGEYLDTLKQLASSLGILDAVTFTGFIEDHKRIEEKLGRCALGVAPYERFDNGTLNFSYFGNPTKLKTYIAAGLPVLLTDVSYDARDIEKAGCGYVITSDPEMIARKAVSILTDTRVLSAMRRNVRLYRTHLDWENIFSKNIRSLL